MKKKLPDFPRIPRFITEDVISIRTLFYLKLIMICFVSGVLMLQIVREAMALPKNLAEARIVQENRQKITLEIAHWKKIADQYIGYRDVYYRIAFLEYSQGNFAEAKKYVQKALEVDPNFDAGRVLGEKIKI
jgi:tetratricopeptide (TPR) repeat protein